MKKMFRLAAIVAVASLTMVACNNNKAAEEPAEDTTAIEQIAEDEMVADSVVAEDTVTVAEATAPAKKKATVKKAEPTQTITEVKKAEPSDQKVVKPAVEDLKKASDDAQTTTTVKRTGRR